jgi:NAD(P)-dependent dehydrogenase (short-subunit alcohol dehydrogenase family)
MGDANRSAFGAETTTDEALEGLDLSGRNVVVTGASGGLGAETGRALAARGANVTLAARNLEKTGGVLDAIRSAGGNVEASQLELTSDESVRAFAEHYAAEHDALHLLINNAGIMACPLARTDRGWEKQFATNHLGHFLLTGLLLPLLEAGAPSRVVCLSSAAHLMSGIDFDDIHFDRRDYDKWVAYGQSKTANALHAQELNRRLSGKGVSAFAVHPGMIMTELARDLTPEDIKDLMGRRAERDEDLGRPPEAPGSGFKSVEAGAATSCFAATAPELEGHGGIYLEDCQVAQPAGSGGPTMGYAAHAHDDEAAARLWQYSEEVLGERFA